MISVNTMSFSSKKSDKQPFNLTEKNLHLLENTDVLKPVEKIDIVLMSLGLKMISEVGMERADIRECTDVLDKLGIPWILLDDKWATIGINKAVLKYIKENRSKLSEIEIGLMYGYPITHALAFAGVFEEKYRSDKPPQSFYMGGVYSEAFFDSEVRHFNDMWNAVSKVSPIIEKQAVDYFYKKIRTK